MTIARRCADGVLIYQHQYEATSPAKYRVIKALFERWAREDAAGQARANQARPMIPRSKDCPAGAVIE